MTDRPFTESLRRRGSLPLREMPDQDLTGLQAEAQSCADWLQSQAAEAQRLADRARKEIRRRNRGPGPSRAHVAPPFRNPTGGPRR